MRITEGQLSLAQVSEKDVVHLEFENPHQKPWRTRSFRYVPTFMDVLRSPIHRFAIVWVSSEITGSEIRCMIVTFLIQFRAQLRFKSGVDPSVRPGLILAAEMESKMSHSWLDFAETNHIRNYRTTFTPKVMKTICSGC